MQIEIEEIDSSILLHAWPKLLLKFLKKVNLVETGETLERELGVVPSQIYESMTEHLVDLLKGFQELTELKALELKLGKYVEKEPDTQIKATPSEMEERTSQFVGHKRSKIDKSNQEEFLDKSKVYLDQKGFEISCARTDAAEINRKLQIRLDVVYNPTGPNETPQEAELKDKDKGTSLETQNQPSLVERLEHLEDHLNLCYVDKAKKGSFTPIQRIQAVELKIIQLERSLPTWSALNFNQPNRKFPPPPLPTFPSINEKGKVQLNSTLPPPEL